MKKTIDDSLDSKEFVKRVALPIYGQCKFLKGAKEDVMVPGMAPSVELALLATEIQLIIYVLPAYLIYKAINNY